MRAGLLLLIALLLPGCLPAGALLGGASELELRSQGDQPLRLPARFATVVYADDDARTTFIASDRGADELISGEFSEGQVLHVELLWLPKPGSTPMDETATNVSIRHVVFSGGEVGIYGGAGFAMPRGEVGERRLALEIRDATLALLESSDGFVDVLGPVALSGALYAEHDPARTRRLYYHVSQHVTNTLGRTRLVERGP